MRRGTRLAIALLVGVAGCGTPPAAADRRPVYAVEGRLLVEGVPAANAHVAFHPRGGDPAAPRPTGRTGPDGTFRLTTYAADDGAPAGEYVVTVVWPNDSVPVDECAGPTAHDRLNGHYADPAAGRLVAAVGPGPNLITLRVAVGSSGWSLPRQRDTRPR
jgi:hypothetical protein